MYVPLIVFDVISSDICANVAYFEMLKCVFRPVRIIMCVYVRVVVLDLATNCHGMALHTGLFYVCVSFRDVNVSRLSLTNCRLNVQYSLTVFPRI